MITHLKMRPRNILTIHVRDASHDFRMNRCRVRFYTLKFTLNTYGEFSDVAHLERILGFHLTGGTFKR